MKVKNFIPCALVCVLGGLGVASAAPQGQDAQTGPGGEHHRPMRGGMDPQRQVNMLSKRLKLTDDQKSKLLPVFTDEVQQMKALREDSSMSREDRFSKMKSIREDSDSKISAVLTDDQKAKYEKLKEERRQRMQERRGGENGDHPQGPPSAV